MTDCTGCHDGLFELPRDKNAPELFKCVSATDCMGKGMVGMDKTQRCECTRGFHYAPELDLPYPCIPIIPTETTDWTHGPNEWEDQSGDHTTTTDWTVGTHEWEDQSGDHTATTDWTSEPNKCLPVEWRLPDNTCTKTCVMSQETGMRPDGRNCVCIMPNHEYFVMPFDLATGTQTGTTAGLPAPKGICIPPYEEE